MKQIFTFKILFYFLIVIIFFFNHSNSINVPIDEYNCISSFLVKFNLSINYPKNSSNLYQLCVTDNNVQCHTNGSVKSFIGNGNKEYIPNNVEVLISDLSCLPYNTEISLNYGFRISQEFLYHKYDYVNIYTLYNVTIDTLNQKLPSSLSYSITSLNLNNQIIELSNLVNVTSFISYSNIGLSVNGIETTSNLKSLNLNLNNLPNLNGYQFESLSINFTSNFNVSDLDNFQYIKSNSVNISFDEGISTPIPFYIKNNYYIQSLEHKGNFETPNQIYNLLLNDNYKSLKIIDSGLNFFYNNEIPFQISNQTNLIFQSSSSSSSSSTNLNINIPNSNYIGKYKIGKFSNNYLSNQLPVYNGSALLYDYSDNKITGTIDSSWCSTNLIISRNQLTGIIPSCFTCYFNYTPDSNSFKILSDPGTPNISLPKMFDRFSGNQFDNYNIATPCTTFRPQVSLLNSTTIIISGNDIGFDIGNFKINSTISCINTPDAIKRLSSEFYCNISPKNFTSQVYTSVTFTIPSKTYNFALINSNPSFSTTQLQTSTNVLVLSGAFFSSYIGQSNQNVYISGNLMITNTTSYSTIQIYLNSTSYQSSTPQLIVVQNGDKIGKVYAKIKSGLLNNFKCVNMCVGSTDGNVCDLSDGKCKNVTCPNNCTYNGNCNTELYGICECYDGYLGDDCSLIQCKDPTCTNGNGVCNTTIGQCECNDGYLGANCSLIQCQDPTCTNGNGICNTTVGECVCNDGYLGTNCNLIQCQDPTCNNGNGLCNTTLGECICNGEWAGNNCDIPAHYITSIEPSTVHGGSANFYGQFGSVNANPSILIDSIECNITFISPTKISCNAPPGEGIHNVTMIQNGITFIGINIYKYSDPNTTTDSSNSNNQNNCIYYNNCNNNGEANNNSKPSTDITINDSTGEIDINSDKTLFKIYIKSLSEIDISNNIVKYYPLNQNWMVNKSNSNIYQTINQFTISSQIEILQTDKNYQFAGVGFNLEKGSIKVTISINNYKYSSFLNTLKLEIESSASLSNVKNNGDDDCNTKSTSIHTDGYNGQSDLNYIKISINNIDLNGRFINKILSDSRPTYISSTLQKNNDSVIISLNLPHCNSCIIDPDFSTLLTSDYKSSCGSSKSKIYVIPVAVVVSCVGVAAIICTTYFLYKKNKDNIFREKIMKLTELSNKIK